jgi:uncharacterized SAM-binding protein YcdF (DUF218 family)
MTRSERSRRLGAIRRWLRRIVYMTLVTSVLWTGGLIWFAAQIPRSAPRQVTTTDAIIVLTGGTGRLETGLQLLAEKRAGKLFVSGVARGVDVAALLRIARRSPDDLACCIAVGYHADDTAGNAHETAQWMRKRGFNSLHLVTANYHMPRSLLEFRQAMPAVKILAHPVFPQLFKIDSWWRFPGTAMLLATEFNKYLVAQLAISGRRRHTGTGGT